VTKIQNLRFATVEQFYEGGFDVDDVLQLSPGRLDFNSTQVDLGGVLLQWNRTGARFRSREVYRGSGVMFGFVRQSPKMLKSFGHEFGYGHAIVWHPGQEVEYVAPPGLTELIVHVDSALADLFGWTLAGDLWQRIPTPNLLTRLEETCRRATFALRQQSVGTGNQTESAFTSIPFRWRDQILVYLDAVLEPWLTPPPLSASTKLGTRHFGLVREAERFYAQYDLSKPLAVDDVAEELGVSRRTLFRAFHTSLGTSPYAYLELVRLHRLRDCLLNASPKNTRVGVLAFELGFQHSGRLSANYKQHFGESPADTLKRV
jgi:AraC-like DNA-binding protein